MQFIGDQNNFVGCIPNILSANENTFKAKVKALGLPLTVKGELYKYEISPETLILTVGLKVKTTGAVIDIITRSKVKEDGSQFIWDTQYNISGPLKILLKPLLESVTEQTVVDTIECIKLRTTS
ncbi:hypothetical protein SUSAZ_10420 [Sulfolobus acidocaldarius SUSAZ]|nr:hypothetical protein SUSAZ_10420 [Sulfolobus acidocaldarius SUSAZ]